jgi:hypothetical protein
LQKSDVSGRKEQAQLDVYGSHLGSMTTGRRGVNTTQRYTSDNSAKRWWPRWPLCVACPAKDSLPAHGEEKRMIARYQSFPLVQRQNPDAAAKARKSLTVAILVKEEKIWDTLLVGLMKR